MKQLIAVCALFLGEVFIIGAEMWAAKNFNLEKPFVVFIPAFIISVIGILLLIYGYTFGYLYLKNIWIVTAISIAGILLVEPFVAWLLFHEAPTLGAVIALVLGIIGIFTALFVK